MSPNLSGKRRRIGADKTSEHQEKEHHFTSDWGGLEKKNIGRNLWCDATGNEDSNLTMIQSGIYPGVGLVPRDMPYSHSDTKRMPVEFTFRYISPNVTMRQ